MNEYNEYDIVTQQDFHNGLPEGEESDWIEFASVSILSGKLAVSDPMFYRDLPPPPTFDVECGTYRAAVKLIQYPVERRVARLRVLIGEAAMLGPEVGEVGVDFAQVGIFDPIILNAVSERMDTIQGEKVFGELIAIEPYGVVHFGDDEAAIMLVARSGFGDGGYPIRDLLHNDIRVGVEVIFIGPEVLDY
jgi:hypothetical protein